MLRIAEAREARGWTQEQLANALGTTQATIQRWESGRIDPQVSKIQEISKALGITVTFLLGLDGEGNEVNSPRDDASTELSNNERQLIDLYRNMDTQYRAMLLKSAEAYVGASVKEAQVQGEEVSA